MDVHGEFSKLLKDISGQDILLQVGPGGKATLMGNAAKGFADESAKEKIQQDVQSMKDFMGKTVEQLAAATEKLDALDVIKVRDRRLVVTNTPGRARTESVLVACLYSLHSPEVDSILNQTHVQGHFQLKDGTVTIQRFVDLITDLKTPTVQANQSEEPKVEPEVESEGTKRNILVGEEEPVKLLTVGDFVVVKDFKGEPEKMGEVTAVVKEDGRFMVEDMYGNNNSYVRDRLIPIESVADATQWTAKIIKVKAGQLGNNG